MWSTHELIVAPATVRGFGARSVVRLAGDGLEALLATLFRPRGAGFTTVGQGPRLVAAWIADEPLGLEWGSLEVGFSTGRGQPGRWAVHWLKCSCHVRRC